MTPWGITIQTDTHGEDVDAAAVDDDYLAFVVFACQSSNSSFTAKYEYN